MAEDRDHMSRADIALVLSGFSLGVALLTFVWRIIFDIYLDAPRVKVTLEARTITGYEQEPAPVYIVAATNMGRRPTTITSLWLTFGRPRRWWWRLIRRFLTKGWRRKLFARGLMTPDLAWVHLNTKIPTRLDVGEQAHAFYSREAVHENLRKHPEKRMQGEAGVTSGRASLSRPIRHPGTERESE
jgi:hypothetical protein